MNWPTINGVSAKEFRLTGSLVIPPEDYAKAFNAAQDIGKYEEAFRALVNHSAQARARFMRQWMLGNPRDFTISKFNEFIEQFAPSVYPATVDEVKSDRDIFQDVPRGATITFIGDKK